MKRYQYKNWEIRSYDDAFTGQDDQSLPENLLLLYRSDFSEMPMLSYLPEELLNAGEGVTLNTLYGFHPINGHHPINGFQLAINTKWFEKKFGSYDIEVILDFLNKRKDQDKRKKRITLLGLGDVGSTLAIGLKLLGGEIIDSIGIFDISENQKKRWALELNQITVNPEIIIEPIDSDQLFSGDMFVFCASKTVPKVGEEAQDVRMIQYEENAKLIGIYAKMARESNFKGVFAVVSDPVDLLAKKVFIASNTSEQGELDYLGLLPEQVVGFGLGVMDGRAKYYSDLLGYEYRQKGRVFGPHGKDLVVSDNIDEPSQERALILTKQVVEANLEVRALGFKPYIAPAISSGANSIVSYLSNKPLYCANYVKGVFWGSMSQVLPFGGVKIEQFHAHEALFNRLLEAYKNLEEIWHKLNA